MKLAILLGNGFDVRIGLDTRYTDFYHYFLTQDAVSRPLNEDGTQQPSEHPELVTMMKNNSSQYWVDLELLFGSQLKLFNSIDAIRREKAYLEQKINDFLRRQQERLTIEPDKYRMLKEQLDNTINGFLKLSNYPTEDEYEVTFITFNYTDVIDRIVASAQLETYDGDRISYVAPVHIHGSIDETVILGVDNVNQYDCPINMSGKDELQTIMQKPTLNNIVRSGATGRIRSLIHSVDAVIIYGASIGDTDATWWKVSSEWLFQNQAHKLSIIGYVDNSTPASATAQAQIDVYEDRFRRLMCSQHQDKVKRGMIEPHRCDKWMFDFSSDVIQIAPNQAFGNLIIDD